MQHARQKITCCTFLLQPPYCHKTDNVNFCSLYIFTARSTRKVLLEHSRSYDFDRACRSVRPPLFGRCLDFLDDIVAVDDFACRDVTSLTLTNIDTVVRTEDHMLSVEPAGNNGGDEKLGAVRVSASIRHGQETRLSVLNLKILV